MYIHFFEGEHRIPLALNTYLVMDVILWTGRYNIMDAAYDGDIYFNESCEISQFNDVMIDTISGTLEAEAVGNNNKNSAAVIGCAKLSTTIGKLVAGA